MKTYQIHGFSPSKKKLRDGRKVFTGMAQITVLIGENSTRRSVTLHVAGNGHVWTGPNPENLAECVAKNAEASAAVRKENYELELAKAYLNGLGARLKLRRELLQQLEAMDADNPDRKNLETRLFAIKSASPADFDKAQVQINQAEAALTAARESAKQVAEQYPLTVQFV